MSADLPSGAAMGETVRQRWTVSRAAFAARTAVLLCTTLIALTPLGYYTNWPGTLISAFVLVPTYMWVLDDFKIWRDNASTTWLLTDQALYIDSVEDGGPGLLRLPLDTVKSITRWPPWSLVLRLNTGVALTLPLVPSARRLKADLRAACHDMQNR